MTCQRPCLRGPESSSASSSVPKNEAIILLSTVLRPETDRCETRFNSSFAEKAVAWKDSRRIPWLADLMEKSQGPFSFQVEPPLNLYQVASLLFVCEWKRYSV